MGDVNNSGEDLENKSGAEGEQGADDTQDESQNNGGADDKGDNSDDKDDAGDGADKGGGEDGDKSDKDKSTDKKPAPKVDEDPTTRKRNVDFILERKNAKIEKLQKDKDNKANQGGEDDDNDDVAPEDAEIIDKRIAKALKPFADKQVAEADKAEIDDFVAKNPDFKPYAEKVAKWAQHPSRQGIPIKSIFYEVAGDDLMKIGADRAKKATDEAKKTGAGGGNNRNNNGGGSKPVLEQTKEEFEATQLAVRSKSRE